MIRTTCFLAAMAVILPVKLVQAELPTETQTFDTEGSAAAAGWTGFQNRLAELGMDAGWSVTNNAGTAGGEAGGRFSRFGSDDGAAYYADTDLGGSFNIDGLAQSGDTLKATGKVWFDPLNINGEMLVAWFNKDNPFIHLGFGFAESNANEMRYWSLIGNPSGSITQQGSARTAPARTPLDFVLTFDPAGGGFGLGEIGIELFDPETGDGLGLQRNQLTPSNAINAGDYDAFGWTTASRVINSDAELQAEAFIDDVTYSVIEAPTNGGDEPVIQPGDLNLDQQVGTADIVAWLGAGTYETGRATDWSGGDFDGAPNEAFRYGGNPPPGNGFSDSGDVIAVLAAGWFEQGQVSSGKFEGLYQAAKDGTVELNDVPEPSSIMLLVCAILALVAGPYGAVRRHR